jgi:hypothetical protein
VQIYKSLIVALVVLVSVPVYFSDYRAAASNIFPRDDYSPYLLAMTGETGDGPNRQAELFPSAPMAHRPLSVAAALPFYYVLPYYAFSNIEAPDEPYLRATAALAFLGWICMLLTALVIYATARRRYQCSSGASLLAALAALLLFNFFDLAGIDALALLLVAILIYFIDRPAVIVPMVLVAAVINEKVVMIALVLYAGRLLESLVKRRSFSAYAYWPQLLASAFAFLGYIVFRTVMLPRPGYGHQLDPSTWLDTAMDTVTLSLSLKGALTNGVPLAAMAVLVVIAYLMAPLLAATNASFRRVDVLAALALLATAAFIGTEFTVGRLVLHAFPVYLAVLAVGVDKSLCVRRDHA